MKGLEADGRVSGAGCVGKKGFTSDGGIRVGDGVTCECTIADGSIGVAGCKFQKRISALRRVKVLIASVRWWRNGPRQRRKTKPDHGEIDQQTTARQRQATN